VRSRRVVANAALIAVLALIVVPGLVGSQNPSVPDDIDPTRYERVGLGQALTVTAPLLDLEARSAGSLAADAVLREPLPPPGAPAARPNADAPAARLLVRVQPVVRPPSSGDGSAGAGSTSAGTSGASTSGGSTAGSWIYDPEISWYGPGFYGNRTACGVTLTETTRGVAHRSLPCGTMVSFRHDGKVVTVPVIDRGPYVAGRTWDLTRGACVVIGHCFTGPIYYRIG
jgi:hypothetical protein